MQSAEYIPRQFSNEKVLLSVSGWLFFEIWILFAGLFVCRKESEDEIDRDPTIEKISNGYFSFERLFFYILKKRERLNFLIALLSNVLA